MTYETDNRLVLTLDAGGTNFVFSAIRGNKEAINPITLPSQAHDLELCLGTVITGFKQVMGCLEDRPVAISFSFPGPADYPNGIIGDLGNLPAFRGGVALGPMLEDEFNIPVFINNDGNLFALGESIAGLLPHVNQLLADSGSSKRFSNLFGVTLGTGFGGGIVTSGNLLIGDNSSAGEIWIMRHKLDKDNFVEEGLSIRAVKRVYADKAGIPVNNSPEPKDIYHIATGEKEGNKDAAITAFRTMGEVLGDALANAITLVDGLIVIGGGLSGAHSLFLPEAVNEMNGVIGDNVPRLEIKAFNLEDPQQLNRFLSGQEKQITVPHSRRTISYDPVLRTGIGISRLGTAKAVGIGAYAFALSTLDKQN